MTASRENVSQEGLVSDLSESQLLARFVPLLGESTRAIVGNGDDSAVLATSDGRFTVSTDVLVEGQHFNREWSTGYDVGYRAAMQNFADAAAMGARPHSMVVALVLPGTTTVAWVEDFACGLGTAAQAHGVEIVGGDLSAGPLVIAAVTIHGDLDHHDPVLRSGARPGDVVAYAGERGRSAAGLALLRSLPSAVSSQHAASLWSPAEEACVEAFLRPEPPLHQGPAAAQAGATSMMDVSDGLLIDAARIAQASGVAINFNEPDQSFALDMAALRPVADRLLAHSPSSTAGSPVPGGSQTDASVTALVTEWVLTGGEDHGILATFPLDAKIPEGFSVVGQVAETGRAAASAVTVAGATWAGQASGWDHFQGAKN